MPPSGVPAAPPTWAPPAPPCDPTFTWSDSPAVTANVAVAEPPSPPAPANAEPKLGPPCAPAAVAVTWHTPEGTTKVKLPGVEKVWLEDCAPLGPARMKNPTTAVATPTTLAVPTRRIPRSMTMIGR